jgi:hypothetical protein
MKAIEFLRLVDYEGLDTLIFSSVSIIIGVIITLFTVLNSFMDTSLQNHKELRRIFKNAEEDDPELKFRMNFYKSYIKSLKRLNQNLLYLLLYALIYFIFFEIYSLCKLNISRMFVYIPFLLLCIWIGYVMARYLILYQKRFKKY